VMIMGIVLPPTIEDSDCQSCEEGKVIEIMPEGHPNLEIEQTILSENQMTIFPNPFTNNFKVTYNFETKGDYLLHVYDVKGQLLFAKSYQLSEGEQTLDLDLSTQTLKEGMYIIQISDNADRILATNKVFRGEV